MSLYDKYYKKDKYFGNPYPDLVKFFAEYPQRGKLADLGAGQGRDAIALQDMGYAVTAVDISAVGLQQIEQADPRIKTALADVYAYDIKDYDFILLDSMLHFYKKDMEKERQWAARLMGDMKAGAVLVNCMLASKKAERILRGILQSFSDSFEIIVDKYIDYPEAGCEFHFLVVKKI